MPEPLIQISNLVKTYETPAGPQSVLQGINLEVERGDFIALVGPSGGGKTTFLNMITGVDRPTSGMSVDSHAGEHGTSASFSSSSNCSQH